MKKLSPHLRAFFILLTLGVVGGLADGIVYQIHVCSQGIGLFSDVPRGMLKEYVRTFPGNVLTIFGTVPWILAFGWLYICEKIAQKRGKEAESQE